MSAWTLARFFAHGCPPLHQSSRRRTETAMEKLVRLTLRRCINKQSFTAVTTAVLLVLCGCSPRRDPAENELRKVRAGKLRDDIAGALAGGRQTELGYVTLDVLAANS